MPKRTTPPLSFGEYVQSHPERSEMVVLARRELMKASTRVLPAFLEELRDQVFPAYAKLASGNRRLIRRRLDPYPQEPTPEHEEVCNLLHLWARRFEAEADWLLGEALQTLRVWSHCRELRRSLEWMSVPVIRKLRIGDRFDFTFEAWDPQTVKWAGFSRALRCRLNEALRTYEKDTRRKAESWGLVRARGRSVPVWPHVFEQNCCSLCGGKGP
jgi:hypothetical protein